MTDLIKQSDQAHELYQNLVNTLRGARERVIYGGKLLFELKDDDSFRNAIGEGIDTWEDFIKLPEIGLSKGEAQRMMDIYEWFVLELDCEEDELVEMPVKALHTLLPIAKSCELTKDEIYDLMNDAKSLNQQDFRDRVNDVRYPDVQETYEFMVMQKCIETDRMKKVHDISSEDIKEKFNL